MGRYTKLHADPHGPGDLRPTALQIVRDEDLEGKLKDKVVVITGAASGIGVETVRALALTGARIFCADCDVDGAKKSLAEILEPGRISLVSLDLASLSSVRAAAMQILEKSKNQVNLLINNAGVMGVEKLELTEDGFETHFATNHLGHFLLFQLLRPALLASSAPDFQSRVVVVASSAHRAWKLDPENYNLQKGEYHFLSAYANSKLATIYMANEIERRYGSRGLHATSLHPGGINTRLARRLGPDFAKTLTEDLKLANVLKSPAQGAATTVYAAISKEWANKGGKYLEDCEESKPGEDDNDQLGTGVCPANL